jgi:hypothetical protein
VAGVDDLRLGLHVCRGNWSRDQTTLLSGGYQALRTYLEDCRSGSSSWNTPPTGPAHWSGSRARRSGWAWSLPNQALDCVDHKHGPNRKLDHIPVDNPVSITGGSGSYPDR